VDEIKDVKIVWFLLGWLAGNNITKELRMESTVSHTQSQRTKDQIESLETFCNGGLKGEVKTELASGSRKRSTASENAAIDMTKKFRKVDASAGPSAELSENEKNRLCDRNVKLTKLVEDLFKEKGDLTESLSVERMMKVHLVEALKLERLTANYRVKQLSEILLHKNEMLIYVCANMIPLTELIRQKLINLQSQHSTGLDGNFQEIQEILKGVSNMLLRLLRSINLPQSGAV